MRIPTVLAGLLCAAFVSGCAKPGPTAYYTLMPVAPGLEDRLSRPAGDYAISVQAVEVPELVDRPQIVIQAAGSAEVQPLNESLWAAPLSNEIRHALSTELSQLLGVLDLSLREAPESLPIWRINVTVQRFESLYGERAILAATWRLAPLRQKTKQVKICAATAEVPVGPGVAALVQGHQQALQELAALIAAQLSGKKLEPPAGVQLQTCV